MIFTRLIGLLLTLSSCSYMSVATQCATTCGSYVTDYFQSDKTTFCITSSPQTNGGTPLYLVIKSTDFAHFMMEEYQQIATLLTTPEEEPSYLTALCIIPGETKTVELEIPEEKALAFYALFTQSNAGWKYLLNTEQSFTKVEVVLGEHEITSVKVE